MRKKFYFISFMLLFFIFRLDVEAARGDLIYNVDSVKLSNNGITITGYSFIHRTQNYHTIYEKTASGSTTNKVIASDGGQKTNILVANCDYIANSTCRNNSNNYIVKSYSKDGRQGKDYNLVLRDTMILIEILVMMNCRNVIMRMFTFLLRFQLMN